MAFDFVTMACGVHIGSMERRDDGMLRGPWLGLFENRIPRTLKVYLIMIFLIIFPIENHSSNLKRQFWCFSYFSTDQVFMVFVKEIPHLLFPEFSVGVEGEREIEREREREQAHSYKERENDGSQILYFAATK